MYIFYDTSAVLHDNTFLETTRDVMLSPITLMELEHLKHNDNASVAYSAREAIRKIMAAADKITFSMIDNKKIDKMLKQNSFLSNINDHRIICAAELEACARKPQEMMIFKTCDYAQSLFAERMPHLTAICPSLATAAQDEMWSGYGKYYPNDQNMAMLYTDPKMNVLKCKTNEFAKIYDSTELKDILFWDGHEYRPLKYKDIKNQYLGVTIKPRNLEQKMAFDLLQNNNIPVKLLYGVPGSGKDYLMLTHALDLVQRGEMDKIIFIRNLVPFKDAPEIGFLAGSLQEKIEWGLGPVASILGDEGLISAQEQGIIEAVNLGFIRGCSWDKTIIYVSEGQNITGGGYKLLISRCGENSQLWINGDVLQTDKEKFNQNNGLVRLINSLSGNELFGTVKLIKTERSKTAELAAIIQ